MVEIVPATIRDACYIAANLRAADALEIGAVLSLDQPALIAILLLQASDDLAFVAKIDGQPVAAFGASQIFSHVYSGWAFGTDRMREAIPAMTRCIREVIKPALIARGVVRLEVRTMAEHDLSHRWLASIGGKLETPEPYVYGRHGELFVTYGWSC